MENIRIGTIVFGSPGIGNRLTQLLPYGFESFSISWWQQFGEADPASILPLVQKALQGSDAVISALSIFCNPLEYDEAAELARKNIREAIDHAADFETDLVTGFTGRLRGKSVDENIERFREVWQPLADHAAKSKVRIAFENCIGGTWAKGEGWNIAFNPDAWELMFAAIPDDHVGLQWEPCHQMVQLIDPMPQIRTWGHKIFALHGKDATIRHDIIARHGVYGRETPVWHRTAGFGDSDWKAIISELRLVGFKGSIDIEGYHDPVYKGDLEMTGQVAALNYLKNCRGGDFVPNPG